jgi:hypothetical protein
LAAGPAGPDSYTANLARRKPLAAGIRTGADGAKATRRQRSTTLPRNPG